MKKTYKKGFTLVELLAVIIILIIVVFLAFNRIKKSSKAARDNTIKANAGSFIKAANGIISVENVENDDEETENGSFSVSDLYSMGLKLSGTKPSNGYIFVVDNEIAYACIGYDDGYYVVYNGEDFSKAKKGECPLDIKTVIDFGYTGSYQTFTVPFNGYYKVELWGAGGGLGKATFSANLDHAGYGGYTSGEMYLKAGDKYYVYVGQKGPQAVTGSQARSAASFNGGGAGAGASDNDDAGGSGGGATDIRLVSGEWDNEESLASRIMVAGGGAGSPVIGQAASYHGGHAGGLSGSGNLYRWKDALVTNLQLHATQTSGYMFGKGQDARLGIGCAGSGGGGGYWGGKTQQETNVCGSHGGGGSSYISGHTGSVAVKSATDITPKAGCSSGTRNNDCSIHYSGKVFTNTVMKSGIEQMPGYFDNVPITGNSGDGHARFTYLSGNMDEIINQSISEFKISYTGSERIFKVHKSGKYKLEVWGAQGGNANSEYLGGYGGYSVGYINLKKGDLLYINVGGAGTDVSGTSHDGGYNGGGSTISPSTNRRGAGGGATHIASKSGKINNLSSSTQDIYIVAGGGGGSSYYDGTYKGIGGHAGGYLGVNGGCYEATGDAIGVAGAGGTQSSGGSGNPNGVFGKGGDAFEVYNSLPWGGAGGGGGYYGGGASFNACGAGGGSGYIGNSLLTNKSMYCYNCSESSEVSTKTVSVTCFDSAPQENCAKEGNGFAKITFVE